MFVRVAISDMGRIKRSKQKALNIIQIYFAVIKYLIVSSVNWLSSVYNMLNFSDLNKPPNFNP